MWGTELYFESKSFSVQIKSLCLFLFGYSWKANQQKLFFSLDYLCQPVRGSSPTLPHLFTWTRWFQPTDVGLGRRPQGPGLSPLSYRNRKTSNFPHPVPFHRCPTLKPSTSGWPSACSSCSPPCWSTPPSTSSLANTRSCCASDGGGDTWRWVSSDENNHRFGFFSLGKLKEAKQTWLVLLSPTSAAPPRALTESNIWWCKHPQHGLDKNPLSPPSSGLLKNSLGVG